MIPDAFLSRRDPDSLRRTLRAGSERDALKFHSNDGMLNPQCGPCSRASSHPSGALWGDAICRLGTVMHQRSGLWTEGELPSQREHVESAQHQAPRKGDIPETSPLIRAPAIYLFIPSSLDQPAQHLDHIN